jgi:broad specificity phosphatase PhoE
MTKLLMVRHGRSAWNATGRVQGQMDIALDAVGVQQARQVAERVRDVHLDAIYSSPLQRARATAEAIGARLSLPVTCDDRLMEYQFGVVSGLTWDEVVVQYPELARRWADDAWAVPIEGSEGRVNFGARVKAVMDGIVARHPDQHVAVVAHGGTFNVYLAKMLGLDLQQRHPFHFGNTSLSSVEVKAGVFSVHFLNDTCHVSTVLDEAAESSAPSQREQMAAALEKIAATNTLADIDPLSWERDQRQGR